MFVLLQANGMFPVVLVTTVQLQPFQDVLKVDQWLVKYL